MEEEFKKAKAKNISIAFKEIDRFLSKSIDQGLLSDEAINTLRSVKEELAAKDAETPFIKKLYDIEYDDSGDTLIDDQIISNEVLDTIEYSVVDREDEISNLKDMACEARQSNRTSDLYLMEQDIEMISALRDEFIFSSGSTNDYISYENDPEKYNDLCEKLLKAEKETK